MGWHQDVPTNVQCFFLEVMDHNYLVFLYFLTIITPALLLAAFYAHIYRVVLKQLRQIVTMNPENGTSSAGRTNGGTMLRMLGAHQKREVKATQNLSIIVLFFMVCWIPLYTINFILAFCKDCFEVNSTFMLFCVILSHLNSAGNPLLYAYHLRDFRAALKNFLFKMIGLTDSNELTPGLNGRGSFPPNKGHNLCDRQRLQSRSEIVLSRPSIFQSESPPANLNNAPVNRSQPKIASIVTQTATLAAVATGETAREIWRISEDPSCSDHSKEIREYQWTNDVKSVSEASGKINNAYIENSIELEQGDDDVFFDDYGGVSKEDIMEHSQSSSESSEHDVRTALNKLRSKCLSSSSPQLTRSGLFFVEADVNKEKPRRLLRSVNAGETKRTKTFSLSGDFLQSPVKSLKLSPLKAVGEFLLQHSSRLSKSTTKLNLADECSVITKQYSRKENSVGVN